MSYKNTVGALAVTGIDSATFDDSFQLVNTGLLFTCFLLRIINDSDQTAFVSYDGINTHDVVLPGQVLQLPTQGNSVVHNPDCAKFPARMQIFIRGAEAGEGLVYIAGYYQRQT